VVNYLPDRNLNLSLVGYVACEGPKSRVVAIVKAHHNETGKVMAGRKGGVTVEYSVNWQRYEADQMIKTAGSGRIRGLVIAEGTELLL